MDINDINLAFRIGKAGLFIIYAKGKGFQCRDTKIWDMLEVVNRKSVFSMTDERGRTGQFIVAKENDDPDFKMLVANIKLYSSRNEPVDWRNVLNTDENDSH
jgi:hypothetical protein